MLIPRSRVFWSVGLAHFTNDIFMSMGPVLLTFLSASALPMTNTQIGFAVSAQQLVGALSQPPFGIMADRNGGRWLGSAGLAFTVGMAMLSLALAVLTGNYFLMLIPFVLQGLGSGAVHPVGMLHTAEADKARVATNMSYFFLLGQAGLALGPTLAGLLLDAANADSLRLYTQSFRLDAFVPYSTNVNPLFAVGLMAVPTILFMLRSIPSQLSRNSKREVSGAPVARAALPWMLFGVLGLMIALRSLATPGSVNFIPVLFREKGWSPAEYGFITSMFWIASGMAGVFFGNLADRYDRRLVVTLSLLVAAPAYFVLPLLDGFGAIVAAIIAGGFSGGSHSIIIVLAQEIIPTNKGLSSGSILGFMFATGALGSLIIGSLSDVIGLSTTFQLVALLTVVAAFMALALPGRKTAEVSA